MIEWAAEHKPHILINIPKNMANLYKFIPNNFGVFETIHFQCKMTYLFSSHSYQLHVFCKEFRSFR